MSQRDILARLLEQKNIAQALNRNTPDKEAVSALQTILHELGFDRELNWARWGANGVYNGGVANALMAFGERNDIDTDGAEVSPALGELLLKRFDIVDDLRHLYNAVQGHKVEGLLFRGSPQKVAVSALQVLLNEAGYGTQLQWEAYGADGQYGGATAAAVTAFATDAGSATDGQSVSEEIAEKLVWKIEPWFGADWMQESQPAHSSVGTISIRETVENGKTRIYVSDGANEVRFTKFRQGVYTIGQQKARDFISANKDTLAAVGLNRSAVNVMLGVSENEGNLDAVNTWDNSFMTFGMFQWTIGTDGSAGELPALLKKVKDADEALFNTYFGQHGLDIVDTGEVTGYFSLNGEKLNTPAAKEKLRSNVWAFLFWKAGQNATVRSIQVRHALARIDTFYRSNGYKVGAYYIADLVSSEYGVGLILDNHVNRPGYVAGSLAKALEVSGLQKPDKWGTAEEMKLIGAYLKVRETYGKSPMTHAAQRAAVTTRYVDQGILSKERGSFQWPRA